MAVGHHSRLRKKWFTSVGLVSLEGLKIVPDYALLTGEKIPPVTPNIIDVRIVRQVVSADFPPPNRSSRILPR